VLVENTAISGDGLFAGQAELSLQQLTDIVVQQNASLQAMTFAWRAAQQRYPQAIALDDPTFMAMAAPASFSSNTTQSAYVLGGAQKLPWFGKRDARGAAAQADASAMFHDVRDARLLLEQSTRMAFYEYYLIARELDLNRQNLELTKEFRDTAQAKYENNQVTQQDVLQAEVESATTERRLLELNRMYRIAIARINTLLRRNPDEFLPAPPRDLSDGVQLPEAGFLRQMAVSQRPDLAAIASRVRAEQAAVELAERQFYPDTEIYAKYDSFWQPASTQGPLRAQVGFNMNVPIYRSKLNAAVCEAQFKLAQRQAEYRQKAADVQFEVESAYAQVAESQQGNRSHPGQQ
jgi:outer membrane protein TolC